MEGEAGQAIESQSEGRRVVTVVEGEAREASSSMAEETARVYWAAVTAPWHPAVLSRLASLPELGDLEAPPEPDGRAVYLIAKEWASSPETFRPRAIEAGARVIEASSDREALSRSIVEALDVEAIGRPVDEFVRGFWALGMARKWLADLTRAMQHTDCLDVSSLTRETLAGATAWEAGDTAGARNRLRAAFELLTEAREKFFPVDAYFVDLLLLEPTSPAGALEATLGTRVPFTVVATGKTIEALASREPATMERICTAVNDGWGDVVGGPFEEVDEPLRPLSSVIWQYRRGSRAYRKHLDDRTVEAMAGRRGGLYPMKPQVGKRFGFRFALHMALDSAKFPVPVESKRLWESPDGSSLESLTRVPVAADRAIEGLRLAWKLGRSMKDDHVAVMPMVHWPEKVAPWFEDLRLVAEYSPVMARWVTAGDFFHLTDRPFEVFRPELDEYVFPYLEHDVMKGDASPIGRRAAHARQRSALDAASSWRALAFAIGLARGKDAAGLGDGRTAIEAAEDGLETGLKAEAEAEAKAAAEALAGELAAGGQPGVAGHLVLNPSGFARRVPVVLPGAENVPEATGPVFASQLTEKGVEAVVTLPPFGFAWVGQPVPGLYAPESHATRVSTQGRTLKNELAALEFDEKSGGLRAIRTLDDDAARMGQQLVIVNPEWRDPSGKLLSSRMVGRSFEPEYGGPALAQAVSKGAILHPTEDRELARFVQRVRLWAGRPMAELEIELEAVDESWLGSLKGRPAYENYLACRWAWPDAQATLRRTSLGGPVSTQAERLETPGAIDVTTRRQRTTLVTNGLAYHKKHGTRMLDTLLVAGQEETRKFELGIVMDLEHPFVAIGDLGNPAAVVPLGTRPPGGAPSGWLVQVDSKNVMLNRLELVDPEAGDGRPSIIAELIETASRSCRSRLRFFRNPAWARQVDYNGETVVDLAIDGDGILLDFTPRELARVEIGLG